MAVVLAVIELNERDGQLLVDKYLYNNSYPDYSEDSYYRLWRETVPFEEGAEDAPSFEWEELVNNTEFDITELKEEKIKEAKINHGKKAIQSRIQAPAGPDDQFHLHQQGDLPPGDHFQCIRCHRQAGVHSSDRRQGGH